MITNAKPLLFGGDQCTIDGEPRIYLTINSYEGLSPSFAFWLTLPQAQQLSSHISAMLRKELENATP